MLWRAVELIDKSSPALDLVAAMAATCAVERKIFANVRCLLYVRLHRVQLYALSIN
jgi:hypothetical protein